MVIHKTKIELSPKNRQTLLQHATSVLKGLKVFERNEMEVTSKFLQAFFEDPKHAPEIAWHYLITEKSGINIPHQAWQFFDKYSLDRLEMIYQFVSLLKIHGVAINKVIFNRCMKKGTSCHFKRVLKLLQTCEKKGIKISDKLALNLLNTDYIYELSVILKKFWKKDLPVTAQDIDHYIEGCNVCAQQNIKVADRIADGLINLYRCNLLFEKENGQAVFANATETGQEVDHIVENLILLSKVKLLNKENRQLMLQNFEYMHVVLIGFYRTKVLTDSNCQVILDRLRKGAFLSKACLNEDDLKQYSLNFLYKISKVLISINQKENKLTQKIHTNSLFFPDIVPKRMLVYKSMLNKKYLFCPKPIFKKLLVIYALLTNNEDTSFQKTVCQSPPC